MNPFGDPLDLYPRRSRRLALLILLLHAVAATMVLIAGIRFPLLVLLLAAIVLSAVWYWRRQRHGTADEVIRLSHRADGTWRWECADGTVGIGKVSASSIVTSRLLILHLRGSNQPRRTLFLLSDSLDPHAHRRLRARLRLTAGQVPRTGGPVG